jgi:hypothetical protein
LNLNDPALQALDFDPKFRCIVDRLSRWREGTRRELRLLAIGPVEPDGQLAGQLEASQRLRVVPNSIVRGGISKYPQLMENVVYFAGNDPVIMKAAQSLFERLSILGIESVMRGY